MSRANLHIPPTVDSTQAPQAGAWFVGFCAEPQRRFSSGSRRAFGTDAHNGLCVNLGWGRSWCCRADCADLHQHHHNQCGFGRCGRSSASSHNHRGGCELVGVRRGGNEQRTGGYGDSWGNLAFGERGCVCWGCAHGDNQRRGGKSLRGCGSSSGNSADSSTLGGKYPGCVAGRGCWSTTGSHACGRGSVDQCVPRSGGGCTVSAEPNSRERCAGGFAVERCGERAGGEFECQQRAVVGFARCGCGQRSDGYAEWWSECSDHRRRRVRSVDQSGRFV